VTWPRAAAAGAGSSYAIPGATLNAPIATAQYFQQAGIELIPQFAAPTITSGNAKTFTRGVFDSFTVTAIGWPIPSVFSADSFPGGLTLHDNHDGTATISGTPTVGSGGVRSVTITARNSDNGTPHDPVQTFTFTVLSAPVFQGAPRRSWSRHQRQLPVSTTFFYPTPTWRSHRHCRRTRLHRQPQRHRHHQRHAGGRQRRDLLLRSRETAVPA
jgi:hypothetical protein